MAANRLVFMACGDVGPMRGPLEALGEFARPVLAAADVRFAHCDRLYTERGSLQVNARPHGRGKPELADVFPSCGFDVVSLAGNLAMDWGEDGLLGTIETLQARGVAVVGAGRNIEEARRPVIVQRNGVDLAILAYCCVLKPGYEAGPKRAGVAPLRIHTFYEQTEYQPGLPPRIVTIPHEDDLAGMISDIAAAKKRAHAVAVSFHWGIHYIPRAIAQYQPIVAEAAFSAGADFIVGHHPHVLKAVGMHGGKTCFYSLGQFIFSTNDSVTKPDYAEDFLRKYGVESDIAEYPYLPYGRDSKHTLIAKATFGREGVERVSFLPGLIDREYRPEMLKAGDPRFDANVRFMDWASDGFVHKFRVEGDEVVVTA